MARSREVRKLDQNRATSSTDSGTMVRLGFFTRNRLTAGARSAEAHGRAPPVTDLKPGSNLAGSIREDGSARRDRRRRRVG